MQGCFLNNDQELCPKQLEDQAVGASWAEGSVSTLYDS